MPKIKITKKYGYIRQGGKVVARYDLPVGEHDFEGDCEVVECANRQEFDAVKVWSDPELDKLAADQAKIAEAIENVAIAEAKKNYIFQSENFKGK